jgi:2-dehydro-3-deoxygluconokinase
MLVTFSTSVPDATKIESGEIEPEMYQSVLAQLLDEYEIEMGTMTVRKSHSAFHNDWSAVFLHGDEFYIGPTYSIKHIIDRIGGGDAFSAAMIYGLLTGKGAQQALDFAVAASSLKHSIPGTKNLVTVGEVEDLMVTGGTGRVKR